MRNEPIRSTSPDGKSEIPRARRGKFTDGHGYANFESSPCCSPRRRQIVTRSSARNDGAMTFRGAADRVRDRVRWLTSRMLIVAALSARELTDAVMSVSGCEIEHRRDCAGIARGSSRAANEITQSPGLAGEASPAAVSEKKHTPRMKYRCGRVSMSWDTAL